MQCFYERIVSLVGFAFVFRIIIIIIIIIPVILLQLLRANYIELCRASVSCLFPQFCVIIMNYDDNNNNDNNNINNNNIVFSAHLQRAGPKRHYSVTRVNEELKPILKREVFRTHLKAVLSVMTRTVSGRELIPGGQTERSFAEHRPSWLNQVVGAEDVDVRGYNGEG